MNKYQEKQKKLLGQSQEVIFPYSDHWVESHREFAKKMWPDKIRRRDETYNRWKFKGPQSGDVNGLLLAVVDNKVVGQLGLIPADLWVDGQIYQSQWACDLMVDSEVRKMGLGSMLFAVAMDRGWVTLGSEPSPLADITMSRIGFKPLVGPYKMILPLDISVVINFAFRNRAKTVSNVLSKMTQPFNYWKINKILKNTTESVQSASWIEVLLRVINAQKTITSPHIVHDKAYLSWRYHVPFPAQIETFIFGNNSYAICEPTPRDYYVYDWHTNNEEDLFSLFSQITYLAHQNECKNILAFANSDLTKNQLRRFGFLKMRTPIKVIYHSEKTILKSHNNFHYCIYDSDGNL